MSQNKKRVTFVTRCTSNVTRFFKMVSHFKMLLYQRL
nr:MAG TPA: hypothetical protein [Caudoviricetes sp.]